MLTGIPRPPALMCMGLFCCWNNIGLDNFGVHIIQSLGMELRPLSETFAVKLKQVSLRFHGPSKSCVSSPYFPCLDASFLLRAKHVWVTLHFQWILITWDCPFPILKITNFLEIGRTWIFNHSSRVDPPLFCFQNRSKSQTAPCTFAIVSSWCITA